MIILRRNFSKLSNSEVLKRAATPDREKRRKREGQIANLSAMGGAVAGSLVAGKGKRISGALNGTALGLVGALGYNVGKRHHDWKKRQYYKGIAAERGLKVKKDK